MFRRCLRWRNSLNCEKQIVLGYRDENLFLRDEFEAYGEVFVATEDGSVGTKGNVLDAIREQNLTADVIYACGPTPMLRAIKEYAAEKGIKCYISLEEKIWHVESAPVWHVSASPRMWTNTAMYTTSGSARMVPYF